MLIRRPVLAEYTYFTLVARMDASIGNYLKILHRVQIGLNGLVVIDEGAGSLSHSAASVALFFLRPHRGLTPRILASSVP